MALSVAGVLAGCSQGTTPEPVPDAALQDLAERGTADGTSATLGQCDLVPSGVVQQSADAAVTRSFESKSSFTLPGMKSVDAQRCDFEFAEDDRLAVVTVRVAATNAEALVGALKRMEGHSLRAVEPGAFGSTAIEAYWQSVGSTLWVRSGDRFASVELVAQDPASADFDITRGIAAHVIAPA